MGPTRRLGPFPSDTTSGCKTPGTGSKPAVVQCIALGRKNYLFVGHPRAGRNIAVLYSLVGSCIANGVEPTEYLTDVLPRIRHATTDADLDALLPDRWVRPTSA
ncbi:MAG: transposase domain-containing protein [Myxococcales bacterium]|nr:transposase domain-containing protein [Myxococcales bacterium]